jgi:imidazolonepropionase-like amidohydrolase
MKTWLKTTLAAAVLAGLLATPQAQTQALAADPTAVLLKPARVFTADDATVHTGWAVLVQGDRIAAVGPAASVAAPPGAEVIALPNATLLPGLMDIHSHLFLHPYNETLWDDQVLKEPLAVRTLRAGKQATATLMAGFTTLRDLGTEGAAASDVGLKAAIQQGIVAGPRLFVATRAIVATGAYGPARRSYPGAVELTEGAQEASGVDEIVKAAREQMAAGADWVKT